MAISTNLMNQYCDPYQDRRRHIEEMEYRQMMEMEAASRKKAEPSKPEKPKHLNAKLLLTKGV